MTNQMQIAKAYEAALFADRMDEVASYFTHDIVYWAAGDPPIGGTFTGRPAVIRAFENREIGLGPADWVTEELERSWFDTEDRVVVEIRERSWLKSAPEDVIDQRTCVVIRFRGDKICEMRDYTDAGAYARFAERHAAQLAKFASRSNPKVNR